jgi:hypothetical protein
MRVRAITCPLSAMAGASLAWMSIRRSAERAASSSIGGLATSIIQV